MATRSKAIKSSLAGNVPTEQAACGQLNAGSRHKQALQATDMQSRQCLEHPEAGKQRFKSKKKCGIGGCVIPPKNERMECGVDEGCLGLRGMGEGCGVYWRNTERMMPKKCQSRIAGSRRGGNPRII